MALDFTIFADGVLAPDLLGIASSVQVEQSLDQPSRYTLRLEVDIGSDGRYTSLQDPRLRPGGELAVMAGDGRRPVCLVRGPIDRLQVHIEAGGAGSWLEVCGGDRRVEMDRVHRTAAWPGRDSDIAAVLLSRYRILPDVADTDRFHSQLSNTQNQSATDLAFLNRLARRNGFHFWITYDVVGRWPAYVITEVGHFRPSPPRPEVPGGAALLDELGPRLQINLGARRPPTMHSIDIDVDVERPTRVQGLRIAEATTEADATTVPDPPHEPLGALTLQRLTPGVERSLLLTTAGDAAELQTRGRAALAEAEWFVQARTRTSKFALEGRLVQPHMLLPIDGLGSRYGGDYFVTGVTHTIDPGGHFMDLTLARNALGA